MDKIEYIKLKELCSKKPQCYCPPEHIASHELANVPEWTRRYYTEKETSK